MPELPEIETVKNVIEPQIKGLKIKRVTINRPEIIERPAAENFSEQITGQTITEMSRRGNYLTCNKRKKTANLRRFIADWRFYVL